MPYETASATGPNDLLDKLRIFALANGWTVDYNGPRTNAGGASQGNGLNALGLSKGGQAWMLYHDTSSPNTSSPTPRIQGYMYPGPFVAASGTDLQANRSGLVATNNIGGPYVAYHFFTDPARTYLHVALEVVVGRFSHFAIGLLNSVSSPAAAYVTGLDWNFSTTFISSPTSGQHNVPFDSLAGSSGVAAGGRVRADSDGVSPRYLTINDAQSAANGQVVGGVRANNNTGISHLLISVAPSLYTGRAILAPALLAASRTTESQRSMLGSPHDLRWIRIDNITPGDAITIGSDTWRVFPVIRKNGGAGIENSGNFGYAYRVVP